MDDNFKQMEKQLNEMTGEELGKLFPIIITGPDSNWAELFRTEQLKIVEILEDIDIIRIEHIGSTAIPNLKAKPTIDILLEVSDVFDKNWLIEKLSILDYYYTPKPENPPPHMMFMKGYSINGFKGQAFHIHVRYSGDWDEIYFRDYLKQHPEIAQEYQELKIQLSKVYKNDREEYTNKKTDFIKRITEIARTKIKL